MSNCSAFPDAGGIRPIKYSDGVLRLIGDPVSLGVTLARLGQLYDEQGDWERAAEYYAKLVELWHEADPELQPRVEAAQKRLDEIFAQRG